VINGAPELTCHSAMRRVLYLKMVTQCAMLEDIGIFLVLADKVYASFTMFPPVLSILSSHFLRATSKRWFFHGLKVPMHLKRIKNTTALGMSISSVLVRLLGDIIHEKERGWRNSHSLPISLS
jgi:hypothetical protein